MPTYIQKTDNSDLSSVFAEFNKVLSAGTGTDTGITISLTSSEVSAGGFITPAGVPNSDDWEDGGTWTVEIEVDTGNHQITANVRVVRLDDVGNVIQVGSFIGAQALSSTVSFSPVAPTWEAEEDCDNRLAIEIQFTENQGMANSVTIGVGTTLSEVVTDITENLGGCLATFVPLFKHRIKPLLRM